MKCILICAVLAVGCGEGLTIDTTQLSINGKLIDVETVKLDPADLDHFYWSTLSADSPLYEPAYVVSARELRELADLQVYESEDSSYQNATSRANLAVWPLQFQSARIEVFSRTAGGGWESLLYRLPQTAPVGDTTANWDQTMAALGDPSYALASVNLVTQRPLTRGPDGQLFDLAPAWTDVRLVVLPVATQTYEAAGWADYLFYGYNAVTAIAGDVYVAPAALEEDDREYLLALTPVGFTTTDAAAIGIAR